MRFQGGLAKKVTLKQGLERGWEQARGLSPERSFQEEVGITEGGGQGEGSRTWDWGGGGEGTDYGHNQGFWHLLFAGWKPGRF